jgi:hypothetical protein
VIDYTRRNWLALDPREKLVYHSTSTRNGEYIP